MLANVSVPVEGKCFGKSKVPHIVLVQFKGQEFPSPLRGSVLESLKNLAKVMSLMFPSPLRGSVLERPRCRSLTGQGLQATIRRTQLKSSSTKEIFPLRQTSNALCVSYRRSLTKKIGFSRFALGVWKGIETSQKKEGQTLANQAFWLFSSDGDPCRLASRRQTVEPLLGNCTK